MVTRIEHYHGEQLVESHTEDALWELMYFGKARSQTQPDRRGEL